MTQIFISLSLTLPQVIPYAHMQVMLLAAGRGTRLGALGETLPKPLVPVCGHPAVAFSLALCRQAGLRDVVVNVHHLGDRLRAALGDGSALGLRIRYSVEEELLGTGGGLARARPLLGPGPVLVMNAKVVADIDLQSVIAVHRAAPPGGLATMVLRDERRREDWNPVGVDATGRVVSLRGQRTDRTPVGPISERVFTGIHVIEPGLLDRLPPTGVSDLIGDAYIPALVEGRRIHSLTMPGFFADPSTPERYLAANLALLNDPGLVAHPPGPLVGVDDAARVHPEARVIMPSRVAAGAVVEAGAVVGPLAVICAGARVAAGARVEQTVVWPDATAEGEVRGAVVTSPPS
jgi:NDP-sugar pyrophosphorylase family protein